MEADVGAANVGEAILYLPKSCVPRTGGNAADTHLEEQTGDVGQIREACQKAVACMPKEEPRVADDQLLPGRLDCAPLIRRVAVAWR
eukprot:1060155-Pyramimonas_sp.AAC.1